MSALVLMVHLKVFWLLTDRRCPFTRTTEQPKECPTEPQAYDPHFAGEVTSRFAKAQSGGEENGDAENNQTEGNGAKSKKARA